MESVLYYEGRIIIEENSMNLFRTITVVLLVTWTSAIVAAESGSRDSAAASSISGSVQHWDAVLPPEIGVTDGHVPGAEADVECILC